MPSATTVRNLFVKVEKALVHSPLLQWVNTLLIKIGVVDGLQRVLASVDGQKEKFCTFYAAHTQEFEKLAGMLEDDFSRLTLERVLEYRKTGKVSCLKGIVKDSQYFQNDIFSGVKDEVFVDGGAYTGDTIKQYVNLWGGV